MPKLETTEKYKDVPPPGAITRTSVRQYSFHDYPAKMSTETITGDWTFEDFAAGDFDAGNYIIYNSTSGFIIASGDGNVRIDGDSGICLVGGDYDSQAVGFYYDALTGTNFAYTKATWAGGAGDTMYYWHICRQRTGISAAAAHVVLAAVDDDGGDDVRFTVSSAGWCGTGYNTFIGEESVNTNMTTGLTIQQGAADDEILALKSTDVGHGAYSTEADTFGTFVKVEGAAGGLSVRGYKDSGGVAGAAIQTVGYLDENADTTKSTAGRGIVEICGFQTSSGSLADTVANGNVVAFWTRRGGSMETIAIIDEDGDLHLDGTTSAYDEEDDALAVQSLAQGLAQNWNNGLRYNFDKLCELGVISGGTPDKPFVSMKKVNALLMGAVGQLYERLERAGIG